MVGRSVSADESRFAKVRQEPDLRNSKKLAVTGQNLLSELRPKRPPIWVYGAPLVPEIPLRAGLFLPYCLSSQRTGTGPAGRAPVPTTQPTTSDSPHGLGGWLDGPGCAPRRRHHAATGVKPPDRCFKAGGMPQAVSNERPAPALFTLCRARRSRGSLYRRRPAITTYL